MTTNRVRRGVIRGRMAASGESYNVAARNTFVPPAGRRPGDAAGEALATHRWEPADSLDDPCPCGGTCAPGERCDRCHATHRHAARTPAGTTDVEVWRDRYDCVGCAHSYSFTVTLPDRPWGTVTEVPQKGGREAVLRVRVFDGVVHPEIRR